MPTAPATSTGTPGPAAPQPATLLRSYEVIGQPDYAGLLYRPRQFAAGLSLPDRTRGDQAITSAGAYTGWDVLATPNESQHRSATQPDWLTVGLSRSATLAVIWRQGGPLPAWLSAWTPAGNVTIAGSAYPTYRRVLGPGVVPLGGVYDAGNVPGPGTTYWLLLAEAGGQPSSAPLVPAGRAVPLPNETCPAWVHDQAVTTGPDGLVYPTWHPQIDPQYWCYFRHEHGSDPSLVVGAPLPPYGYTATVAGEPEAHPGFKSYAFDDDQGHSWLLTQHFGTASLARACNRFHETDVVVTQRPGGQLVADLHFLGDYGASRVNRTDEPLRPTACPTQADDAAASTGVRLLPVVTRDAVPYEPWRLDQRNTVLGIDNLYLTINTGDGLVICNDVVCDTPVVTGRTGTFRFFTPLGGFGLTAGANTGVFFTDPKGLTRVAAGTPGAVRQFLAPGTSIRLVNPSRDGHCFMQEAWRGAYACGPNGGPGKPLEGAIGAAN